MRVSTIAVVCALALAISASGAAATQGEPAVIDTISVGHEPAELAVNPLTGRLFVSNEPARSVVVVDTGLGEVIETISLGLHAGDLAVNALTNRVYVSARCNLHNCGFSLVAVIDGESNSLIEPPITVGCGRGEVIVDPFANLVYAVNSRQSGMFVIDGDTHEVSWTWGPLCRCIGVNPLHPEIYVSDESHRFFPLSRPDLRVLVPDARRTAVGPRDNRVYITQGPRDQITVMDGDWEEAPVVVPVGEEPQGVATNTLTGRVYVANSRSDTVSVIQDNTVVATVAVGGSPRWVAVDPLTELVYVANTADGTVSVIEDASLLASPDRVLIELVSTLMVDAGADAGRLQDALGFIGAGDYDKAAQSLLAFSEEIQARPTERGEKLADAARKIIMMMIGN
jgi:YVTN family beta-propeller protein